MVYYKVIDNVDDMNKYEKEIANRSYSKYEIVKELFDQRRLILNDDSQILIGVFDDRSIVGYTLGHIKDYGDFKFGFQDDCFIFYRTYQSPSCYNSLTYELSKWFKNKGIIMKYCREEDFDYDKYKASRKVIMDALDNKISTSEFEQQLGSDISPTHIKEFVKTYFEGESINIYEKPLYTKCHDIYAKYLKNEITIEEYTNLGKSLDINVEAFALDYAIHVEGKSKEEIEKMKIVTRPKYRVLNSISNIEDKNEIFMILSKYIAFVGKDSIQVLYGLYSAVSDFLILKYGSKIDSNQFQLMVKALHKKISDVQKVYADKKKEEYKIAKQKEYENSLPKLIKDAQYLVEEFVLSNMNLKDYLLKKSITQNDFNKALEIIKNNNGELYQKYCDYINGMKSQRFAVLVKKADLIVDCIKSGIINDENNQKREFDILDYYISSNLSPAQFIRLIEGRYNNDTLKKVKVFFAKNKCENNDFQAIKDMKYIVNSYELTEEQKNVILHYLKSINAPYNMKLFRIAVRRYLNGELFLDNGSQIIKK